MAKHETLKEIERAEKALEATRIKHREAFRKAIANTFEEFGLALAVDYQSGKPGSCLVIVPFVAGEAVEPPK